MIRATSHIRTLPLASESHRFLLILMISSRAIPPVDVILVALKLGLLYPLDAKAQVPGFLPMKKVGFCQNISSKTPLDLLVKKSLGFMGYVRCRRGVGFGEDALEIEIDRRNMKESKLFAALLLEEKIGGFIGALFFFG
jgi:hypothetical protein